TTLFRAPGLWSLSSLLVTVRSQTSKRRGKNRCSWKRREGPGEVAGPKRLARSATEAASYPSTTRTEGRARRPVLSAAAAGRSDRDARTAPRAHPSCRRGGPTAERAAAAGDAPDLLVSQPAQGQPAQEQTAQAGRSTSQIRKGISCDACREQQGTGHQLRDLRRVRLGGRGDQPAGVPDADEFRPRHRTLHGVPGISGRCAQGGEEIPDVDMGIDRKSTRLNSSHVKISYAVFCLKKKTPLDST